MEGYFIHLSHLDSAINENVKQSYNAFFWGIRNHVTHEHVSTLEVDIFEKVEKVVLQMLIDKWEDFFIHLSI